jgi:hypothetical protein
MTPTFELSIAIDNTSTPESIKNADILSSRFSELQKDGNRFSIKRNYENEESVVLNNHYDEELCMYPETGEWTLNKEDDLVEHSFNLLGKVNLIPFMTDNGGIRVLMTDNDFEKTIVLPLEKGSSWSHFYGKLDPYMYPERGDFYNDRDEYIESIELLEEITDLEIIDFFIRVTPATKDTSKKGEIRESEIQLAIELK